LHLPLPLLAQANKKPVDIHRFSLLITGRLDFKKSPKNIEPFPVQYLSGTLLLLEERFFHDWMIIGFTQPFGLSRIM
jgi:hypothetical protein